MLRSLLLAECAAWPGAYPLGETPSTRHMVAIAWSAWWPFTNSNPAPGSTWSPWQTRPRLIGGSRALPAARALHGAGDAPPPSRRLLNHPCVGLRPERPAPPSFGWHSPRARTCAPAPRVSARPAPALRAGAGTQPSMDDVSWAW